MKLRLSAVAWTTALLASAAACAAGLEVNQFAYRSPDLMVFIARTDAGAEPSPSGLVASAALGSNPMRVRSLEPWNAANGATIVVAVDVSGSMKSVNFKEVQRALDQALGSLPALSRAALLTIGAQVQVPVDFGPMSMVRGRLLELTADAPETALNEGLLRAQRLAVQGRPELPLRRFVLLVTDGVDESKKAIGTAEMLTKVENSEVPIYMVAVTQAAPRQRPAGLEPLASVARASRGAFVQTTPAKLGDDLKAMLLEAMRVDLLTLDCRDCVRDGAVRTLQVKLSQGTSAVSGVREARLLHDPMPVVSPPPPDLGPEKSFWDKLFDWLGVTERIGKLIVALLALLLPAAAAAGGYVYRERIRLIVFRVFPSLTRAATNSVVPGQSTSRAPDSARKPLELTVDVAGAGRQQVSVGATDVVLGRSPKVDISTEKDNEASGKHAALYVEKGILMVRDLGSSNGTYLNGTPIVRPEPLHDRDVVRIGRTDVRIFFGRL
jgi:hypothetical protein